MTQIFYNNPVLKPRRQDLRKNQTDAEKVLWRHLRGQQLDGFRFFRQYSVGPYILDFYCPQIRLAVELDGGQHAESDIIAYDKERTQYLKSFDIKMLRFWNNEMLGNTDAVLEKIRYALKSSGSRH